MFCSTMANVKMLIFDVVVLAYVIIGVATLTPWILISVMGLTPFTIGVSDGIYHFFSLFCHQLPYRSLFFDGAQQPVCARCASIYVMTALGLIFFRLKGFGVKEFKMNYILLALLFAPTGLDGLTQLFGWRESTNDLRLITGAPYGLGYAYILIWAVPFIYVMLELIVVAFKRDDAGVDAVLKRIKYMVWPFTKAQK